MPMRDATRFYIEGEWVEPARPNILDVINPATEEVCGRISLGSAEDIDRAVRAARRAFDSFSRTSREERLALLQRIIAAYKARMEDVAQAITAEMGAPSWLAQRGQAGSGLGHFLTAANVLEDYEFEAQRGTTLI